MDQFEGKEKRNCKDQKANENLEMYGAMLEYDMLLKVREQVYS